MVIELKEYEGMYSGVIYSVVDGREFYRFTRLRHIRSASGTNVDSDLRRNYSDR